MAGFNQVILMGNLTADPREFGTRTTACEFSLAVNEVWYDADRNKREEVYFGTCKAFGRTASTILAHARKGTSLQVVGRLSREQWDDKDTGKKREATRIIVKSFVFTGSKRKDPVNELVPGERDTSVGCPDPGDDVPF